MSDGHRVIENHRLNRAEFQAFIVHQPPSRFVMEACGGSHHWARLMLAHGHSVRLLPVPYVRAYRRRNKTDRADCMAMLEADRNPEILSVPVKRVDAQAIQGLHRARSAWMGCRTARINALRGLLREFGVILPLGAQAALKQMASGIDDPAVPDLLKITLLELLAEVHDLDDKIARVERQLATIARQTPAVRLLQDIPGIGLLTSTALYASAGDAKHFRSGRLLASWLGLTPKEHSSGFKATSRWHQQARRQVRPHAVDPRRTHRLARCPTQRERGQATESAPAMGFGRTGPFESQQGRLRRGQQAGPNRLGELG